MQGISGMTRFHVVEGKENDTKIELKLAHEFTTGQGYSKSLDSILFRPLKKVIEEGSNLGKVYNIFFRQDNTDFLFGAFSVTDKRLLFFPPMAMHRIDFDLTDIQIKNAMIDTQLDHISLDSDLIKWHYSYKDKNIHNVKTNSQRTIKVDNNFFLWFVWRFKSIQNLEKLPQKHEFYLSGEHKPEVKRRAQVMIDAVNSHDHPMLLCNDPISEEYFWNVEFFITKNIDDNLPNFPSYACHDKSSIVKEEDGNMKEGKGINKISIDSFEGTIWIRIDKQRGSLKTDHVFISPSRNYEKSMQEALTKYDVYTK